MLFYMIHVQLFLQPQPERHRTLLQELFLWQHRVNQTTISLNSYCMRGNPGVMSLVTWQNQAVIPSFTPGPICTVDGEKIPVGKKGQ